MPPNQMSPEPSAPEQVARFAAVRKQLIPMIKGAGLAFMLHSCLFVMYHFVLVKPACLSFAQTQFDQPSSLVFDDVVYPSAGKHTGYHQHFFLGYGQFHTVEVTGKSPHEKRVGLWQIMGSGALFSIFSMPFMFGMSLLAGANFFSRLFQVKASVINKESL
ncbi:MAG: hypothetical protein WC696_06170 [Candidatus Methylopumilus sp.]|jgi:hypothetical protein